MEDTLTLNDVIEYITKHITKANYKNVKKNDTITENTIDTTDILETIFDDNISKIKLTDVITTIPESENNISMCSSILSALLEMFDTQTKDDKIICVTQFFAKIVNEVKKRTGLSKYITTTLSWDKKELVSDLLNYKMTPNVIAYIMTYLNINIFVISEDEILLYCIGKTFNVFKQTILIYYDGTDYKPISYNNSKYWDIKTSPLNCIIKDNSSKIKIYQQNEKSAKLTFKLGYDDDIELIWQQDDEQQNKKNYTRTQSITSEEIKHTNDENKTKDTCKKHLSKTSESDKVSDHVKNKSETSEKQHKSKSNKNNDKKIKQISHNEQPEMNQNLTTEQLMDAVICKPNEKDDSIVETNNDSLSDTKPEFTEKELTKQNLPFIKKIALANGIKITIKKDGKTKSKTKQSLIDELLAL